MPSKKKKYNARFPPARIKKIMQTDEEVGKVASAVPVIISRALELFIDSLICKSADTTRSKNAKTLSVQHIKQTIHSEKQFDFLKDLVAGVPDVQHADDDEAGGSQQETSGPKPRGRPRKKKIDGEPATPQPKKRKRSNSRKESTETDSATEEADSDDCGEGSDSQASAAFAFSAQVSASSSQSQPPGGEPSPSTSASNVNMIVPKQEESPLQSQMKDVKSQDIIDSKTSKVKMPFQAYQDSDEKKPLIPQQPSIDDVKIPIPQAVSPPSQMPPQFEQQQGVKSELPLPTATNLTVEKVEKDALQSVSGLPVQAPLSQIKTEVPSSSLANSPQDYDKKEIRMPESKQPLLQQQLLQGPSSSSAPSSVPHHAPTTFHENKAQVSHAQAAPAAAKSFFRPFQTSPPSESMTTRDIPAQVTSALSPKPQLVEKEGNRVKSDASDHMRYMPSPQPNSPAQLPTAGLQEGNALHHQSMAPVATSTVSRALYREEHSHPTHRQQHSPNPLKASPVADVPQDLSRHSPVSRGPPQQPVRDYSPHAQQPRNAMPSPGGLYSSPPDQPQDLSVSSGNHRSGHASGNMGRGEPNTHGFKPPSHPSQSASPHRPPQVPQAQRLDHHGLAYPVPGHPASTVATHAAAGLPLTGHPGLPMSHGFPPYPPAAANSFPYPGAAGNAGPHANAAAAAAYAAYPGFFPPYPGAAAVPLHHMAAMAAAHNLPSHNTNNKTNNGDP